MMHPNQIPTSPALVGDLLQRQYPMLANEPISETPFHGTDSDTYRVGKHHSVRLPIIDWAVNNETHMRPWLPWLQDRLAVQVSGPIFYGEPDCGYPHGWTVYPWLPGEPIAFGCDDPQVAIDIAAFLHELRALPTEGAPSAGRSPHALDTDVRKCLAQLAAEDHRDDLIAVWEAMMTTPAWDGSGVVWMHGDVAPGNLLFINGRLKAAIDWSALGIGDPASDLQVAWNMLAANARAIFREAMGADDATWERARARAFAQASFQLPYYRESLPALAQQAQWVFGEILEEFGR
ncbi:MAG: aminoglycoside phosphotransferase family protein [Thermomicrobiales bacterium]|nr:aminoglycoside phosphotransferase family protein [Thermomicrobiales bacterium]